VQVTCEASSRATQRLSMGEFSPAIEVQVTRLQIVAICGLLGLVQVACIS
jgi:hypothetical protein